MPLNAEQQKAVNYLEGPLLVLAGPGTGKTQLLSAKVAHILTETDASPENILCLTFTDAGAENMRDRLKSMIGKAAEKVNIYTYHAFGKTLLDRYCNYSDNLTRKLETPIDDITRHKLISGIQQKLPPIDILRDAPTAELISLISNAKSARLSSDDLRKIAAQNVEDATLICEQVSPILEQSAKGLRFAPACEQIYEPILAKLVAFTSEQSIVGNIERIANTMVRELHTLIEQESAKPKPSVTPLSNWRKKYFELNEKGNYRLQDFLPNKRILSLSTVMERYNDLLMRDGLFDFDDMIESAIQFLRDDAGFRLSLSELFQYILLDEFQDTNPSQFELIKLITDYDRPVVMAVGDDDQAIYAFQGANASNLMDFREHYGAEVISLVKNYRSTGDILATSRGIADQIEDSFAKSYQNVTKVLQSVKDQEASQNLQAEVCRHEFPCAEAEYYWIASEIARLVQEGEKPEDIAILAPKHKFLARIVPYLKEQNLPIAYEKRENILEDEKIHMLCTLAEFIAELASAKQPTYRLLEILSYEFWQLPLLDVMQLFAERPYGKSVVEILSADATFAPLAQFFADLAAKSFVAPIELWLDYLIGVVELNGFRSPFLDFYHDKMDQAAKLEFYENLSSFCQAILAHIHSLHPTATDYVPKLADFIITLKDYRSAEASIARTSNYSDGASAVQVMTAYKSKGLEFKYVFLPSMDNSSWGRGHGNNDRISLPKNLIQIRHTGMTDDECLRLLFVAMTRAKNTLIITNSSANSDGKNLPRLNYLNESSPEDVVQISKLLPEKTQTIISHADELSTAEKLSTLVTDWTARYQKLTPEFEPTAKKRLENYRLSASDLTTFVDLCYGGPAAIYQRRIMHAPSEPSTPSQCYGTLAHKVFEQVVSQGIDDDAALKLFRDGVPKTALEPDDQETLLSYDLGVALTKFGPILRSPNARAEVNLSSEHPSWQGIPLTGTLDLILVDKNTKTIEVYDYKTGKYHDDKWTASLLSLYKYRLQLGFYKLLLQNSPSFQNYQVTRGHILFVTPDPEGKVYDKVYEYNSKDDQELKDLIQAVYHQITTLNFIKDPEIFISAAPTNGMPQIRAFVQKLLSKE